MQANQDVRESMFIKIQQWQSSGLTQKAFCASHHIRYHVFHYWYKVFKDNNQQVPLPDRFVQLDVPSLSSDVFAEIHFTSGNKVTLYQPVNADYLKALM
jgi:hypothetical protein